MRITAHLDRYDPLDPDACAIIWLDKQAGKWSREAHVGAGVPPWGLSGHTRDGTCLLAGNDRQPLCLLEGLDLASADGPFEGETGAVRWLAQDRAASTEGRWHVQCIDTTESNPDESLFADEGQ
ncbi:DUF3564 family protein [Paraburkholderia dinghuensis]|uniref:DUF3564 family protein n=1 Tax=Paraburkholderia dinghuensis TaxID=2305225 RepID=A0A3N6MQ72_9BURK|nr:DUF3564 family protein [Paraburkholderia dinghuensis]RQH05809.1 DUF3564 family protein [Paraburkholderia dinghuensis]